MQAAVSIQNRVMDYMGVGDTFDASRTFLPAGQSAGLVHGIKPAGEIVRDIITEAQKSSESASSAITGEAEGVAPGSSSTKAQRHKEIEKESSALVSWC
jgi:hypothetical protein